MPNVDHVKFSRNGVASVDSAELLKDEKVREQYRAAKRIVEKQRAAQKRYVRTLSKWRRRQG